MFAVRFWCFATVALAVATNYRRDPNYWKTDAKIDIERAEKLKRNENAAKNVVLFVGDGMGLTTVTASRIYGPSEEGCLAFEEFPNVGVLKIYSADKYVPDSCSTATAMFCGVKANHKTSGVDASVQLDDCEASLIPEARLDSLLTWAQKAQKSTGFVTTTRVTHATPSALYSHVPNRKWECEQSIPEVHRKKCKDIARQLMEQETGRNLNVVMGGGRQCLVSNTTATNYDPLDTWACISKDGRNLIKDWKQEKEKLGLKYAFVQNNSDLNTLDYGNVDYVLGIFANGHMRMEHERDKSPAGTPSLSLMTLSAYNVLKKNSNGFFLIVEGGMIDFAHHRGKVRQALSETVEFSNAVKQIIDRLEIENLIQDTLVIVTSDHSHSLVMSGYADRGKGILDVAQKSKIDDVPYTTLMYGTGGPDNYQYFATLDGKVERKNPEDDDKIGRFDYIPQAGVLTDEVTHDGTDVLVYAKGPMAHLFHSVHEQTYVAYVIAYASKVGPFSTSKEIKVYSNFCLLSVLLLIVGVLVIN